MQGAAGATQPGYYDGERSPRQKRGPMVDKVSRDSGIVEDVLFELGHDAVGDARDAFCVEAWAAEHRTQHRHSAGGGKDQPPPPHTPEKGHTVQPWAGIAHSQSV